MEHARKKGLLIGAGHSRDLGMPLVSEVTAIILGPFSPGGAGRLASSLLSEKPYGKDRPINEPAIRAALDLVLDYKAQQKTNYEELLAALEHHPANRTQSDRDSFHRVFTFLYELTYSVLAAYQRHSYDVLYPRNRRWFEGFSNLLSTDETWIFSLNHDLYVECLALDFGVPITYGDTERISFPINNLTPNEQVQLTSLPQERNRSGQVLTMPQVIDIAPFLESPFP